MWILQLIILKGMGKLSLLMKHPQIPWKIQMWILKWRQWKKKLKYVLLLATFWEGKRGMLKLWDGDQDKWQAD
jgi:hypothetical protein